jgi:hypothetical protein
MTCTVFQSAQGKIRSDGGPVQDAAQHGAGKVHDPRISGLLCQPTLPDAIQPKGPFCILQLAVRHYRCDTLQLSHQSRRHLHGS